MSSDIERDQIKLAQTATFDELKQFIALRFFFAPAEIALIERGDDELIKLYISRFSLSEDGQCALAVKGSREVLLFAAEKEIFKSHKAIILLAKRVA